MSNLLSRAVEPGENRGACRRLVGEDPCLGGGESGIGRTEEVVNVRGEQTRLSVKPRFTLVERLREKSAVPGIDQISGRDVFDSGSQACHCLALVRVEGGDAKLPNPEARSARYMEEPAAVRQKMRPEET